jgi:hypothetical protein
MSATSRAMAFMAANVQPVNWALALAASMTLVPERPVDSEQVADGFGLLDDVRGFGFLGVAAVAENYLAATGEPYIFVGEPASFRLRPRN